MHFVYPQFLFALFAVTIPVIIHLFNFRRYKKIYFTNVKYIKNLQQQSKKKSNLKHLILLIIRILIISCIVIAFAQPYFLNKNNKINHAKKKYVSIFIDNSFSMQAHDNNFNMLETAKKKAKEIASAYNSNDLFQLLTNDFEGKHQRFYSKTEFIDMIDDIKISISSKKISEIIKRQKDILTPIKSPNKELFLISDFQKNMCDFKSIVPDTNISSYLIPLYAENSNNLYIDSCWVNIPFYKSNQNVILNVRIKNSSSETYDKKTLKLFINNIQKAIANFDIKPNAEIVVKLNYVINNPGINQGKLKIIDYPVTFDDEFFFSYFVHPKIPILVINNQNENKYLNSLLGNDSLFFYKNVNINNLDYSIFSNYNLIIINELKTITSGLAFKLNNFIKNGGSLMVVPADNINFENYNTFLNSVKADIFSSVDTNNTKISSIDLNSELFNNVFEKIPKNIKLPDIYTHYVINTLSKSNQITLLRLRNNDSFLNEYKYKKGKVYLFAAPFNKAAGNFQNYAIFVPTIYKIAFLSNTLSKLFYTLGKDEYTEINASNINDNLFKIKGINNNIEIIPEQKKILSKTYLFLHNQIKKAGNYFVVNNENKNIKGLSYNYDRKESYLKYYSKDLDSILDDANISNFYIIKSKDKNLTKVLTEINKGVNLWKLFLIFALILLLSEVIILRVWE